MFLIWTHRERILPHFPMIVVQEEKKQSKKKGAPYCLYTCSSFPAAASWEYNIIRRRERVSYIRLWEKCF
jgi:hypothetical protein